MIDLDNIVAIDVHTHAETSVRDRKDEATQAKQDAMAKYFKDDGKRPTIPEMARYYRERRIACVVFTVDTERATGEKRMSNEEVCELANENGDVMIPFASIDPLRGRMAVREARHLIDHFGVRGFKFHPSIQDFYPNDRAAYPLYEVIAEARLPALFHTGQTGVGAGQRGGGGIRLKYSHPMHLDDVAVDFPDMPIILAHPSFPWQEEALSVATHKPQVYIDLSGWSPKYFPPILVQYANTILKDKILFGSDYPVITPERWIEEFEKLPIKPEVRPLIMKQNAARLLKLA
jgi:uncharacterized protein